MMVNNMDGFYTVNDEYITREKLVKQMIQFYYDNTNTRVTDFNEGSEIRNLIEACASIIYDILEIDNDTLKNHFVTSAEGEYLDLIAEQPNVGLKRDTGTESTGLIKFTIPEPLTTEWTIPQDTICTTEDGLEFSTDNEGYIVVGETSCYVQASCLTTGTDGNIGIGEITSCDDEYYTVTNEERFKDGTDYEEDEEFRERILSFIRLDNFGSLNYYISELLNLNDKIHDIYVITENTTPYDAIFIPNTYYRGMDEQYQTVVTNECLSYLSDSNNIILGQYFNVISPVERYILITISNVDFDTYGDDIWEIIMKYVNGGTLNNYPLDYKGLDLYEEITLEMLEDAIKQIFPELEFTLTASDSMAFENNENKYNITVINDE